MIFQKRPHVVPLDTQLFWSMSLSQRLIWASKEHCQALGVGLDRLIGLGYQDFLPPEDMDRVERAHVYCLSQCEPVEGVARVLCRDGYFYRIAWRKVPRFVNFQVVDFSVSGIVYGWETWPSAVSQPQL